MFSRRTRPLFSPLSRSLMSEFQRESDNRYILAQLYSPRTTQTGGLENQYRIVKSSNTSGLAGGQVLIGSAQRRHLLVDNGQEEINEPDMVVFKSVELDRQMMLSRKTLVENAQTLRSEEVWATVGPVWVSFTPLRPGEDKTRIGIDRMTVVTGTAIALGEKLDNYYIENVDVLHGAYQATLRAE